MMLTSFAVSAKQKAYIMQALRKVWLLSDARASALRSARVGKEYLCANCQKPYMRKEVHVDHIEPIGSFIDWNIWIERLFCAESNLQILCKTCHLVKTKRERRERSEQ